jgi:transcription antitermination factor NusG
VTSWNALYIRRNCEHISAQALIAKGYEVYLPVYKSSIRPGRTLRLRPLFPGYLFCRTDVESVAKIVTTPGVISFVNCGRTRATIEDSELADVRRVADSNTPKAPWMFLPFGTRVRVENGPLAGICGVLVSDCNSRRLVVSVQLLQRSIAATLSEGTRISAMSGKFDAMPLLS